MSGCSASGGGQLATRDSCLADVNNLAGFISRKRPSPRVTLAHSYYATALRHVPTHCPTLGYLAELHVMTSNVTGAALTAQSLCAPWARLEWEPPPARVTTPFPRCA